MYDALIEQISEALGQHAAPMNTGAIEQLLAGLRSSDILALLWSRTAGVVSTSAAKVFAMY
jgi:hypothetical protein